MPRPTKYQPTKVLPLTLELMKQGASKTEVSAALGISRDTLYAWTQTIPEFSDTIKRGEELSQAWWEQQGRINLYNKSFSYTGWYMNMKNRFGWRDSFNSDISLDAQPRIAIVEFIGDER